MIDKGEHTVGRHFAIRKLGHSCLLVETSGGRILMDPGRLSSGLDDLGVDGVDGVLITHQHGDHLDESRLARILELNPDAVVVCDEGSVGAVEALGVSARVAHEGDRFDLSMQVEVFGSDHATIHPDLPRIPNVGYLLEETLFHPGDALTLPDRDVPVVAVPTVAPWIRTSEMIDYVRALRPGRALAVHDAIATMPGMYVQYLRDVGPKTTEVLAPTIGEQVIL